MIPLGKIVTFTLSKYNRSIISEDWVDMIYEEKKTIVIHSIIEAKKLEIGNKLPTLYTQRTPLNSIEENEVINLIIQFKDAKRIKIGKVFLGHNKIVKEALKAFGEDPHEIELTEINMEYFENEFKKYKEYFKDTSHISNLNEFYITYTSDRRILLNGKIEIAKPDFDSENDKIFSYIYERKNQVIKKSEIQDMLKGKLNKDLDKVLENLGFVKGIRSAFFDVNKETIRLKTPVKL